MSNYIDEHFRLNPMAVGKRHFSSTEEKLKKLKDKDLSKRIKKEIKKKEKGVVSK